MDKVVTLLHDSGERVNAADVVLCFSGNLTAPDAALVAKDLWGAGIKCLLLDNVSYFSSKSNSFILLKLFKFFFFC